MLKGQSEYWRLDLNPDPIIVNGNVRGKNKDTRLTGSRACFAERDLYTRNIGGLLNVDIEKIFFGKIDDRGRRAVIAFDSFDYANFSPIMYNDFLRYLSSQKLRTPKGLDFISNDIIRVPNRDYTLISLRRLSNIYAAIWSDSIWQIADASQSETKFIISDHPVTVYNRKCPPGSSFCKGSKDPDVRCVATQTIFPLSLNKILIITNLSWVRNPYQNELADHANTQLTRNTMFDITQIQTDRFLSESEVLKINYIIKRRAFRYIAAAQKSWLYPESHLKHFDWSRFGHGYLLMPEPRNIYMRTQISAGFGDGRVWVQDEYGRAPGERNYSDVKRRNREFDSFRRFQAEWAAMFGPKRRGFSMEFSFRGRIESDSDAAHARYLAEDEENRKKISGERRRRRSLREAD